MLPEVARKKFDAEVEAVRRYAAHGRPGYAPEVVHAAYPRLVVKLNNPAGEPYYLRVDAAGWNTNPASYTFVRATDHNATLPATQWPGRPVPATATTPPQARGPFRPDHQPVTDVVRRKGPLPVRPFICLEGTREFHRDGRHQTTPWDAQRHSLAFSINTMIITIQDRIYTVNGVTVGPAT
jgi:hypothetical protein